MGFDRGGRDRRGGVHHHCQCRTEKTSTRLIAKVRYFDGSLDTLEISGYSTVGSCVRLRTIDGRQTILGANNVIIIEEVEDQ